MGNEIRVGGSGPDRTQFASHLRPAAQYSLDPPLGDFASGSPAELSPVAVERIYLFNERLGRLPMIATGDGYASLAYERWALDEEGIHLFMRCEDGAVVEANVSDGSLEASTPDDSRVSWILRDYGIPAEEASPLATP